MSRRIQGSGCGLMLLLMLELSPMVSQAQHMVEDLQPGMGSSFAHLFTELDGKLFFRAHDGSSGMELWVSDGTAEGTKLFKDINPGRGDSSPLWFTEYRGLLFFEANDGMHGGELWVTEGTVEGTHLFKDIWPGSGGSFPGWFTEYRGLLFFNANDGTHGRELWVTDGTEAGTHLVKDISPGPGPSNPGAFINFEGKLFFSASDGMHGYELWISDGTAEGTHLVKDIYPGSLGSFAGWFAKAAGKLLFSADDGQHGFELWVSDGTEVGTHLAKDIWPGGGSSPRWFTEAGGKLLFRADDETHGGELWITDGTEAGTHLVKDIYTGRESSLDVYVLSLTEVGGKLYFEADDGTHGDELWVTDGTPEGTTLLKDINPNEASSYPDDFAEYGGRLYFAADDGTHGEEPWVTDGTEAGTRLVADIYPGSGGSDANGFAEFKGRLYFQANDGTHGREPWVYDPSAPPADTTPPTCSDPRLIPGPFAEHPAVFLTATDPESGIASLSYELTNAHGFYDAGDGIQGPFPDGHTEALTGVASLTFGAEKLGPAVRSRIVVTVTNGEGLTATCDPVLTTIEGEQPLAFRLDQNYPNPFNPTTTIPFAVAEPSHVHLVIYDVLGREVATLVDRALEAGAYEAVWDGTDSAGAAVAGGLYLCRLTAGTDTETQTMTLLK